MWILLLPCLNIAVALHSFLENVQTPRTRSTGGGPCLPAPFPSTPLMDPFLERYFTVIWSPFACNSFCLLNNLKHLLWEASLIFPGRLVAHATSSYHVTFHILLVYVLCLQFCLPLRSSLREESAFGLLFVPSIYHLRS